jgi:hypothetical protein
MSTEQDKKQRTRTKTAVYLWTSILVMYFFFSILEKSLDITTWDSLSRILFDGLGVLLWLGGVGALIDNETK